MFCLAAIGVKAEVFSTSPNPVMQSSNNIKVLFNAQESGVTSLINASELYAHIGVTVDGKDWEHVIGTWSTNDASKKFTKNSNGIWELNIGDFKSYFDLADGEIVEKICVIARTANGSAQTKDYFINVKPDGFYMNFTYNVENLVISGPTVITFNINTTEAADLSLKVDNNVVASMNNATSLSKAYRFEGEGNFFTVTASAVKGNETLTETVTVAYPAASAQENYPGGVPKQGAVKQADGSVIFCLAAPNKKSVIIVPSWDDYQTLNKNVMKYQDYNGYRYFWTKVSGLKNDEYYPYYYLVDGIYKVADPYAKLMLDNYSDKWMPKGVWNEPMPAYPYSTMDDTMLAVYRGDIDDYNWDSATLNFQIPDHKSMVVYELLLRDFTGDGSDSDGKMFGTLRGAKSKIGYLKDLGVNVVELLPVMEFAGNSSWGYNTNGYMALDKIYGSPRDLKDFVAECHRNGIAVVLDIVFNQTDGLHPWYQMYPIKTNPFYNETAPHSYSVLNDLRQDYPLVEQHFCDVLRYWMEAYKVDGYRFDLVKGLGDNSSYGNTDAHNNSRVNRMKRFNDAIRSVKADGIHINELLGAGSEDNANFTNGGQIGWNNVQHGAGQYAMGFADKLDDTKGFYGPNWSRTFGAVISYGESHDEPRLGNKVKKNGHANVKYTTTHPKKASVQRLGSTAAQMLLSPGPQMIWQFGEIGADDDQGAELDKLRPIAPKWDQFSNEYRDGLYQNYRHLVNMRAKNADMFDGSANFTFGGFAANLETVRYMRLTKGNREIIGVFNPAVMGAAKTVSVPVSYINASNNQLVCAAYGFEPTLSMQGSNATVSVPPHCFAIFSTSNVSDTENIAGDIDASSIRVYGSNGQIVIEGDYENAEVYDLSGRMTGSLSVPAGIYVVRVDGQTFKVSVR